MSIGMIFGILIGIAFVILFLYFFKNCVANRLNSTIEEKIGLTKLSGHYDANGVLVISDDEFHLSSTGSFKRFDQVDSDLNILPTDNQQQQQQQHRIDNDNDLKTYTLQQPQQTCKKQLSIGETSISPIPRPVSSMNMSALASKSQFPITIDPPPQSLQNIIIDNGQEIKDDTIKVNEQLKYDVQQDYNEVIAENLKRAISCESLCSDTSVVLGDLEESHVTGYLCIALEYDSELSDLIVNVLEAKDLTVPISINKECELDSYVRVFLLPEKHVNIQTKMYRCNSSSTSYKERFLFTLNPRDQSHSLLNFHVYSTDHSIHALIGEGEIRLSDISLRQPVTTWITLTDTGQVDNEYGEIMFSISYLPTAERLTVVVVKARNVKYLNEECPGNPFVKVYLMQHGKKICKKKTSFKKPDRSPIFNEAMIFSVPSQNLQTIQLRLTVAETHNDDDIKAIGHVIVGAQGTGRSLNHWKQMLVTLRKPVAMWHPLRK